MADKEEKVKKPNAIQNFYRETVGELRKVNWPTTKDALHLTKIVLIVLALMSAVLGLLDHRFLEYCAVNSSLGNLLPLSSQYEECYSWTRRI